MDWIYVMRYDLRCRSGINMVEDGHEGAGATACFLSSKGRALGPAFLLLPERFGFMGSIGDTLFS